MRNTSQELSSMDKAGNESIEPLLKVFNTGTPGDIVDWLDQWMGRAGYKRLCRILRAVNRRYKKCSVCYDLGSSPSQGGPECPECGHVGYAHSVTMKDL